MGPFGGVHCTYGRESLPMIQSRGGHVRKQRRFLEHFSSLSHHSHVLAKRENSHTVTQPLHLAEAHDPQQNPRSAVRRRRLRRFIGKERVELIVEYRRTSP